MPVYLPCSIGPRSREARVSSSRSLAILLYPNQMHRYYWMNPVCVASRYIYLLCLHRFDPLIFSIIVLLEHQGLTLSASLLIIPVLIACLQASDLVLVDPEGYVAEGGAQLPINSAGFYIHSAIHKARPDIEAAAHCHSIHARTWSVFGKPIELLTQDSCVFHNNLSVYKFSIDPPEKLGLSLIYSVISGALGA